jgi:uncharacterized protein (TIGR03435 family)
MKNSRIRTGLAAATIFGMCVGAQTPLAFDVASVKPAAPGGRGGIVRQMPGNQRYIASNVPLRLIMTVAYSVTDRQISGGPSWVARDPFDIDAKAAKPGTSDDLHVMLAHLLEERFKLSLRHETRELPLYELVVDKNGPKMPEHDPADLDHPPMGGTADGMKGTNVTMNYFAFILSRNLDRSVIDKTGLTVRYDVSLQYAREGPNRIRPDGVAAPVESEGPTIFTAVREQLGLKLVPARGPVEFLVIEHAEKPAAN